MMCYAWYDIKKLHPNIHTGEAKINVLKSLVIPLSV